MGKVNGFNPARPLGIESTSRDRDMEVRVVVEATTKRVLHHNHAETHTVSLPCPILQNGRSKSWKIVLQMPMGAKDRPENVRHSQHDSNKGNIWKRTPLLSLPARVAYRDSRKRDSIWTCRCDRRLSLPKQKRRPRHQEQMFDSHRHAGSSPELWGVFMGPSHSVRVNSRIFRNFCSDCFMN